MKSKPLLLGVVALCALPAAVCAQETELVISSGTASETFSLPTAGTISETNLFLNGWHISTVSGQSFAPSAELGISRDSLAVTCDTHSCLGSSGSLTFTLTGTGFTEPVSDFTTLASVQRVPTGMTRTVEGFWDAADGLGAETSPIGSMLTFTGRIETGTTLSTSSSESAGPTPYSLTLLDTFTTSSEEASAVTTLGSVFGTLSAPEPGTILLLGSSLLLLGISRRKRRV